MGKLSLIESGKLKVENGKSKIELISHKDQYFKTYCQAKDVTII